MAYRTGRLAETIKKEVSDILRNNVKDPRVGFVTITDVEVSGDKRHAKVYFSVMGDQQDRKSTQRALSSASGFIRNELGQRLTLRYTPELEFYLDESLDEGIKIQQLLQKVHESDKERGNMG